MSGWACALASCLHHADLRRRVARGGEGHDPAEIHRDFQADDVDVEGAARGRVVGVDVGDDPPDRHQRLIQPPSTVRTVPVTYRLAGEQR